MKGVEIIKIKTLTQSIEDETKAREISFHERLAASERKSNSPQVTRGSYQFPTPWFSRRGEKQIPTTRGEASSGRNLFFSTTAKP